MNLIIDIAQLQYLMQQGNARIVDVRSHNDYLERHIEGAVHFELSLFNQAQPPVAGLLPSAQAFNAAVSILGITPEQPVIVYDDAAMAPAARFAWTMLAYSHQRIALLDGGFRHWLTLEQPVVKTVPETEPLPYQGRLQHTRIADRAYILQGLESLCIIDTRSPAEYIGADLRANRGGHIPGAINLNWELLKSDRHPNVFKPATELTQLFQQRGVKADREIVCYCQSHQRSSVMCIVLEHLGYQSVRGYPGAWSDWGNRDDTPVEI